MKGSEQSSQCRRRLASCLKTAALASLILLFSCLLFSVAQVASLLFFNPPTTMPIILRSRGPDKSAAPISPARYEWKGRDQLPDAFFECVWIAEDGKFFSHHGFDWNEIARAWGQSQEKGRPSRGASTITQQCARSLFLWQKRSWSRKGLEAYYTVLMEIILPKNRILEIYANVIEFGDGIYGLEAAAQHYFNKPALDLTREEAALLVAIMPNPRHWDPLHPNDFVKKRLNRILAMARPLP